MASIEHTQRLAQAKANYDAAVASLLRDDKSTALAQKKAMELAKRKGTWSPYRVDPLTDALADFQEAFSSFYVRQLIGRLDEYLQALDAYHGGALQNYYRQAIGSALNTWKETQTRATFQGDEQAVSATTYRLLEAHLRLALKTCKGTPSGSLARTQAEKHLLAAWAEGQSLGLESPVMDEITSYFGDPDASGLSRLDKWYPKPGIR